MGLAPPRHSGSGDDKGEIRGRQINTDILDKVFHVLFVLVIEALVDAIIPPLMPGESHQLVPLPVVFREVGLQIGEYVTDRVEDFHVVETLITRSHRRIDTPPRSRRTKIHSQAFSTPGGFDQQYRLVVQITQSVTDLQLRAHRRG